VPPSGYGNLIVNFSKDGQLKAWFPGQTADATEGEYSTRDGELRGWMGLSNDFHTPRPIGFPADGWLELGFPDGFVATFRRVAQAEPIEPGCAFFTVKGHDFDAEQVARSKRALFAFQPEAIPAVLQGTWRAQTGHPYEGSMEVELAIDHGMARFTVRSLDAPGEVILDRTAPIEVAGDFLRTQAIACGGLHSYSVNDGVLELTASDEPPLRMGRVK